MCSDLYGVSVYPHDVSSWLARCSLTWCLQFDFWVLSRHHFSIMTLNLLFGEAESARQCGKTTDYSCPPQDLLSESLLFIHHTKKKGLDFHSCCRKMILKASFHCAHFISQMQRPAWYLHSMRGQYLTQLLTALLPQHLHAWPGRSRKDQKWQKCKCRD